MAIVRGLSISSLAQLTRQRRTTELSGQHVFICVADHYEPKWQSPPASVATERVERWISGYPKMAVGICDSRGRSPQHTFFYPAEEYEPEYLDAIAKLCRDGYGDVDVHLHHDGDTADNLRASLLEFNRVLHEDHGLMEKDALGRISYGFIHGNWALDNSRPDGRWCGVNNEISILLETGCYADFTMPSAPACCQTSTINSIYYAKDDPERPKSHDTGNPAQVGTPAPDKQLLMVQGPLAFDWSKRKWGFLPGIENGDLTGIRPPTLERFRLWIQAGVRVTGRPDWVFVKLHTHGAQERNAEMLLGEPMRAFHQSLRRFADEQRFKYYYVTAREMASLVHQAEAKVIEPNFSSPKAVTSR